MYLLNRSFNWIIKQRLSRLQHAIENPIDVQSNLLCALLQKGKSTAYGQHFHFNQIITQQQFKEQVPICTYEALYPYIEKILKGQNNILWPTSIKWFAKSSGTSNDRSKFIPVSAEALNDNHYKAGKDMLATYLSQNPHSQLFQGKNLALGGSLYANNFSPNSETKYGDVSAVIMKNLPLWAKWASAPDIDIALLENWEEKLEKLAQTTANENITSITGIPTWLLILLNTILHRKGATNMAQVWPMLELFIHGGVSFTPYKDLFKNITSDHMQYLEVYNASEGFFAIQDDTQRDDLLLLVNHGIYYEFISMEDLDKAHLVAVSLENVQVGHIYAMVITTNAGLWRYQLGDTVQFTSTAPFRIKIAGRTNHYINTFGEELVVHNADAAITHACLLTGATISDYTAGPQYTSMQSQGHHEWLIEFIQAPSDLHTFAAILDHKLQALNSDYEAKRYKNLILGPPLIKAVPKGIFYAWMKQNNKLGNQNKVPRLFNSRKYLDDIYQRMKGHAGIAADDKI
eukprot:gene578-723_t